MSDHHSTAVLVAHETAVGKHRPQFLRYRNILHPFRSNPERARFVVNPVFLFFPMNSNNNPKKTAASGWANMNFIALQSNPFFPSSVLCPLPSILLIARGFAARVLPIIALLLAGEMSALASPDISSRPHKETPTQGRTLPLLERYGIKVAGWLEQGFTANPAYPANRSNLPVIFNDRANDYQLNQFWIHAGRPVRADGHGFDIGGRIDLTYGTDSHFTTASGLENSWNSPASNMQLAMPQLYGEVALGRFSMLFGHYLTPIGYEYTPAAPNFFYSHSYNFNFEPGTFTGTLATYRLSDQLRVSAGFQRGAQTWTPQYTGNDRLGVVAAGLWTSRDRRVSVQFAMSSNRLGAAGGYCNNTQALVVQYHISRRLHYVFEEAGWQNVVRRPSVGELSADTDFRYGICQYLFYEIDDCWKTGVRFSWNGYYQMQEAAAEPTRRVLNYNIYSATFGLNWRPCPAVVVRPEIRIDWSDAPRFDGHTASDQLLLAIDAIIKF